jgi:hypothetical protein
MRVFRNNGGAGILTDDFSDVAQGRSGVVYALEAKAGRVLRLQDLNADGDAQDPGETTVFRDGTAEGMRLKGPVSLTTSQFFDVDADALVDVVYIYDAELQVTARLQDRDRDNDAQGSDEICVYHQSLINKPLTSTRMAADDAGRVLSANPNMRAVIRTIDLTGDCNANVKPREATNCPPQFVFNEYHVVKDVSGLSQDLVRPVSIAFKSEKETIFVGEPGRAQTEGEARILHLLDANNDEDAQDAGEVTVFSNGRCAGLAYVNPTALAVDRPGRVYMSDFNLGLILQLEDTNGDNDALDPDECRIFARGFGQPVGLAIQPEPLPPLEIRLGAGILDLGKKTDLLLPDGATQSFSLEVVDRDTSIPVPNMKLNCDAVSGCLLCDPKTSRTNAAGGQTLTVSRVGAVQSDEGLVVSTMGATVDINVTPTPPIECPFGALLEGDEALSAKSTLIYTLRDKVLARSRDGQRYVRLFRRHATEITLRLMWDRALRARSHQVMGRLFPVLRTRLAKDGLAKPAPARDAGPTVLARADVADIEGLMNSFSEGASPELQKTLAELKRELRSGQIAAVMGIPVQAASPGRVPRAR